MCHNITRTILSFQRQDDLFMTLFLMRWSGPRFDEPMSTRKLTNVLTVDPGTAARYLPEILDLR
jgi:hypothetical protein